MGKRDVRKQGGIQKANAVSIVLRTQSSDGDIYSTKDIFPIGARASKQTISSRLTVQQNRALNDGHHRGQQCHSSHDLPRYRFDQATARDRSPSKHDVRDAARWTTSLSAWLLRSLVCVCVFTGTYPYITWRRESSRAMNNSVEFILNDNPSLQTTTKTGQ